MGDHRPDVVLRRVSPSSGSTSATASSCGSGTGGDRAAGRAAARAPAHRTPPGTGSPRCWSRPGTPSSAPTCAATAGRRKPPTTAGPRALLQAGDGRRRRRADAPARARPVRRRRARPGQLRGAAAGDGPPGRGHAPRRARLRPDRRGARPLRRPVRRRLVALVLLRPARQARAGDQRRPGRLVRRRPGPRRWGRRTTPTTSRAIHDPATVRAMLEDYRAGLGVDRAHDEADRAAGRRITCPTLVLWSAATTSRSSTATRCRSGRPGRPTCAAADRSTAATTWPRRRPTSWPARCSTSCVSWIRASWISASWIRLVSASYQCELDQGELDQGELDRRGSDQGVGKVSR